MKRLLGLAAVLFALALALPTRSNMVMAPWGGAGTTSGVTTWDPAQKGAGITLSPDGRTASSNSTSLAAVRSVTSRVAADGKRYFELGCEGAPGDNSWVGGVESASGTLVNFVGSDAFGSGYLLAPSIPKTMWWYNNSGNDMASSPPCASSSANRIHYAFDATAGLIWSQVYTAGTGSGRWNGILVTAPAAPTVNGWTVPFAGPYFIAWSGQNNPTAGSSKIYNDASNIEGPVPTGYVVWNSTGAAVPVNTALPAVTGSTSVGSVLTSTNGTWTNSPTSFAYQWKRDGTTNIGTSVNTYTIVTADQGHSITDVVTASNASGPGAPATSNSVSIPGGGGPVVLGTHAVGTTAAGTATSSSVTLTGLSTGQLVTGFLFYCRDASCSNVSTGIVPTSIAGTRGETCTDILAAAAWEAETGASPKGIGSRAFVCTGGTGASTTITVTMPSTSSYMTIYGQAWTGASGVGCAASNPSNVATNTTWTVTSAAAPAVGAYPLALEAPVQGNTQATTTGTAIDTDGAFRILSGLGVQATTGPFTISGTFVFDPSSYSASIICVIP